MPDPDPVNPALIAVSAILLSIGALGSWAVIGYGIFGREWKPLALRFRAKSRPEGKAFRCTEVGYRTRMAPGCFLVVGSVVISDEGLYVQPGLPRRFACPSILVPWSALTPGDKTPGYFDPHDFFVDLGTGAAIMTFSPVVTSAIVRAIRKRAKK